MRITIILFLNLFLGIGLMKKAASGVMRLLRIGLLSSNKHKTLSITTTST
ncbi:MAG: hypothetical protein O2959_06635 [Proteobacteria bacterium]|nr:hypothetical protein [Pseudomonadota bacterium]